MIKKPSASEAQEQIVLIEWASLMKIHINGKTERLNKFIHHSPNGGKRHTLEALKFKRMGVLPGFPDLFVFIPTKEYHGLFVELKRANYPIGNIPIEQFNFMNLLKDLGFSANICKGFDEAKKVIVDYLKDILVQ